MNRAAGLATAEAGDTIIVRAANGTAMDLLITGTPVDSGTYYTIPVSVTTGTVTKGARTQIGILSPTPHGIPTGGTDGQVLTKTSGTDYAADWETPGAGYTDEQVRDVIGTALVAGNNIDITVTDAGDTITVDVETLTKTDVGLGNVDNTADTAKPVSTAQAAADALKVSKTGDTMSGDLDMGMHYVHNVLPPVDDEDAANMNFVLEVFADAPPIRRLLNAQTGTTYTPVVGDENLMVTLSNAAAITVTLPQNSARRVPGRRRGRLPLARCRPAHVRRRDRGHRQRHPRPETAGPLLGGDREEDRHQRLGVIGDLAADECRGHGLRGASPPAGTDVLMEPFNNFTDNAWTVAGAPTIVAGRTGTAAQAAGATSRARYTIPAVNQSDTITVGFACAMHRRRRQPRPSCSSTSDTGATDHNRLTCSTDRRHSSFNRGAHRPSPAPPPV